MGEGVLKRREYGIGQGGFAAESVFPAAGLERQSRLQAREERRPGTGRAFPPANAQIGVGEERLHAFQLRLQLVALLRCGGLKGRGGVGGALLLGESCVEAGEAVIKSREGSRAGLGAIAKVLKGLGKGGQGRPMFTPLALGGPIALQQVPIVRPLGVGHEALALGLKLEQEGFKGLARASVVLQAGAKLLGHGFVLAANLLLKGPQRAMVLHARRRRGPHRRHGMARGDMGKGVLFLQGREHRLEVLRLPAGVDELAQRGFLESFHERRQRRACEQQLPEHDPGRAAHPRGGQVLHAEGGVV